VSGTSSVGSRPRANFPLGSRSDSRESWIGSRAGTEAFLTLVDAREAGNEEFEALAERAVRGAQTEEEFKRVLEVVEKLELRPAIPAILPRLTDPRPRFRAIAVSTLTNLRVRETAPRLLPLLEDEESEVRKAAAQALRDFNAIEHVPAISALLDHKIPGVRSQAARLLSHLHAKEWIPRVVLLLQDPSDEVRAKAVTALVKFDARDRFPEIASLLRESDHWNRSTGARALGRLGAREFVDDLSAHLNDPEKSVRVHAADSLARLESPVGIATLLETPPFRWRNLYGSLNALRRPDLWRRLSETRLEKTLEMTSDELVGWISERSYLILEIPDSATRREKFWRKKTHRILHRHGLASVLEVLEEVVESSPYEFILESDRVRFVRSVEAHAFWKEWAVSRSDKER